MALNIVFMGTPEFSVSALKSLHDAGHNILAVYSQPPRPSGRGHKVIKSPVHILAELLNIPVFTPASLRTPEAQQQFENLHTDVAVVVAYGLILPKAILDSPKYGCINIHASLLPRWRGAAPIQRAILAGDKDTGITTMQMDEGLDTGEMLLQEIIPITTSSTASQIHDRLSQIGAHLIVKTLYDLEMSDLYPQKQPADGVTYAGKLSKEEGLLNWQQDANVLERKIRALNPWPGVWFEYQGDRIKVLEAEVTHLYSHETPGTVLDDQLTIACGEHSLRLLIVQKAGAKAMTASEFLNGNPIIMGDRLS